MGNIITLAPYDEADDDKQTNKAEQQANELSFTTEPLISLELHYDAKANEPNENDEQTNKANEPNEPDEQTTNDDPNNLSEQPIIEMSNLKPITSYTTKFATHNYKQGDYYYDSLLDGIISFKIKTKALKPTGFVTKPVKLTKCKAKQYSLIASEGYKTIISLNGIKSKIK
jgi:hypothetical protein